MPTNPSLFAVLRLPLPRSVAAAAVLTASACLPAVLRAGEAAHAAPPPRLSVLMGLADGWRQDARAPRGPGDTLLDQLAAETVPSADPFTAFNALPTAGALPVTPRAAAGSPDAPVALPESAEPARPTGYAASGFAPTTAATSGYSHAAFAADMLAAPARAHIASELRGDWLGHLDDARPAAATVVADRAPQSYPAPAWTTAPVASFAPAAYAGVTSTPAYTPHAPATSLPASVAPIPAAVGVSGAAYGWGYNLYGDTGNGTPGTNVTTPTPVNNLGSGVTSVASGVAHSVFVQNGAVYAVGYNNAGQFGNGTTAATNVYTTTPQPALVLTSGVTAVAAGFTHSLAIQNGGLYTWGRNDQGQLGNGSSGTNVVTPTAVNGFGSGVTLIAGSQYNCYAVQNGALFAAGGNSAGQIGNGSTLPSGTYQTTFTPTTLTSGVAAVSTGQAHVLALQNGALYSWGFNTNGQLGNGTSTGTNGTNGNPTPTVVGGLGSGVTAIAAGYAHSLAVQNGSVFAWGNNQTGQLGTGSTLPSGTYQTTPLQVPGLSNIIAVAAAEYSSYALAADGSLYVWGRNNYGQLGLGDLVERDSPVHLLPPSGFYYSAIDGDNSGGSGFGHVEAILTAGTPVPEPATWAGGALLLAGAGWTLRRRLRSVG